MIPIVTVQVAEPAHEHVALMLKACTDALRRGRCELAPPAEGTAPEAVAIVSWRSEDHAAAQIEVGTSEAAQARWVSRGIDFQPGDPPVERWRVVGITIATLVGDLEEQRAAEEATRAEQDPSTDPRAARPEPAPIRTPSTTAPAESPVDANARGRWRASAGLALDPGLASSQPRLGGWARGGWQPFTPLLLTSSASAAGDTRRDGVSWTWLDLAVGAGLAWPWPAAAVEPAVRVEVLLEGVSAAVDEPTSASSAVLLFGARLSLDLTWPVETPLALVGGLELTQYSRGVRVRVEGDRVSAFPSSTLTVVLGARLAP